MTDTPERRLREELAAIFEHGIEGDNIARIEALFDSRIARALAVRTAEAVGRVTAKMLELRDATGPHFNDDVEPWFRNNLPNLYVLRDDIRSLSSKSEQAALEEHNRQVRLVALTGVLNLIDSYIGDNLPVRPKPLLRELRKGVSDLLGHPIPEEGK